MGRSFSHHSVTRTSDLSTDVLPKSSKHDLAWHCLSVQKRFDLVIPYHPGLFVLSPVRQATSPGPRPNVSPRWNEVWNQYRSCGSSRDEVSSVDLVWVKVLVPAQFESVSFWHHIHEGWSEKVAPILMDYHLSQTDSGVYGICFLSVYFVAMATSHCWSYPIQSHYPALKRTGTFHIFEAIHQPNCWGWTRRFAVAARSLWLWAFSCFWASETVGGSRPMTCLLAWHRRQQFGGML